MEIDWDKVRENLNKEQIPLEQRNEWDLFRDQVYFNENGEKEDDEKEIEKNIKAVDTRKKNLMSIERFDINTVTGIVNTVQERDISEIILGMHRKATVIDSFLGAKTEQLLKSTNCMVVDRKSVV